MKDSEDSCGAECLRRRTFVKASAVSLVTMMLADVFPDSTLAQDAEREVVVANFPRTKIANLSELKLGIPIAFDYPSVGDHTNCLLIKLGKPAGGGIGPDKDVVAFSARCTHMGGDMSDGFIQEHNVLGCGEHLSTFDLTRHGILVAGHATDRLPQIVLETEDDEILATGIVGLLYGYHTNPTGENV